jgi:hypothetical protein
MGCLNIHSSLEVLGSGRMLLCASHVVILHMISWICSITDYTAV